VLAGEEAIMAQAACDIPVGAAGAVAEQNKSRRDGGPGGKEVGDAGCMLCLRRMRNVRLVIEG
jgi:hypothetical protein